MLIILVRIHSDTTKREIINFISPVLQGGLFAPKGILENIKIVAFRDGRTNTNEFHAILQVEPDKAALRVIHKLNRKKLNGKPINVRQYHIHNRANDPRQYQTLKNNERRLGERRRASLEMLEKKKKVKFESNIQYTRKLHEH